MRTDCVDAVSLPQLAQWDVLHCLDGVQATFGDVPANAFDVPRRVDHLKHTVHITSYWGQIGRVALLCSAAVKQRRLGTTAPISPCVSIVLCVPLACTEPVVEWIPHGEAFWFPRVETRDEGRTDDRQTTRCRTGTKTTPTALFNTYCNIQSSIAV